MLSMLFPFIQNSGNSVNTETGVFPSRGPEFFGKSHLILLCARLSSNSFAMAMLNHRLVDLYPLQSTGRKYRDPLSKQSSEAPHVDHTHLLSFFSPFEPPMNP